MARARGQRCTRTARTASTPAVPQQPRRSARINETNSTTVVNNQNARRGQQTPADRRTIILDSGNTARAVRNSSSSTATRQPAPPVSKRQDLLVEQQLGPSDVDGMSATSAHLSTGVIGAADSGAGATTFSDSTPTVTPSNSFTQQSNLADTQPTAVTTPPVKTVSHVQHVLQQPSTMLQPTQQITSNLPTPTTLTPYAPQQLTPVSLDMNQTTAFPSAYRQAGTPQHHALLGAGPVKWRRYLAAHLPRMDNSPQHYPQLRDFFQRLERLVPETGAPLSRFDVALEHMGAELRSCAEYCMCEKYPGATPTRSVPAGGKPLPSYLDLSARTQTPPTVGGHEVVKTYLKHLPRSIRRRTRQRAQDMRILGSLYQVAILAQYHETLHISGSADSSDDEGRRGGKQVADTVPPMPQGQTSPVGSPQQPLVQQQFLSVPQFTPRPARQGPYSRPHHQHPRDRRGHSGHDNPNWRVNVVRNDHPHHAFVNQQNPNRIPIFGCYRCRDTRHGIAQCPVFADECRRDPTRRQRCSGCDSSGGCPPSCGRRLAYENARHPYIELNYHGRSYYVREDGPMPQWYSPALVLSRCGTRAAPAAATTSQVATLQHNNLPICGIAQPLALPLQQGTPAMPADSSTAGTAGSTTVSTAAVINTVMQQIPEVNSVVRPISSQQIEEMPPNLRPAEYRRPTHTRALATVDGTRWEVISDTGADVSLVSASMLRPNRKYKPWTAEDGSVKGGGNQNLQILGRIALTVTLGPLTTRAPFVVVLGVSFSALLGVDFLYENDIAVSLAQHALLFEGHGGLVFPLIGQHPRHSVLCATAKGVAVPTVAQPEIVAQPRYVVTDEGFMPKLPSPGSCLTAEEMSELEGLLTRYQDRFNDGTKPLPATTLLKARLDTGDVAPISAPPRRLSPMMREVVRKAVAELDAQGITEPSTGNWSTPIVMVKKASGAWRLCCDYREINKFVKIPQQPSPRTDDILASFKGKQYFSVMDMCSGFYQIEIEEADTPKTAFVTPDCQRQYRRLPFGFASSPAIFQRMVDMLIGDMKWVSAIAYIDDVIIYSDTWFEHVKHLTQLFEKLRSANLQLHPGKCCFGAAEVKYLGHVVSRAGLRACPSKVRAIAEMPAPKSARGILRFLGKCQYYRKFIPNFSAPASPLYKMSTKKQRFEWTEECAAAWEALKEALQKEPVLAHLDYARPFYLDCDGSADGLGAILQQPHDDGERVIAYASRALHEHEKKWTATELEAAAIIWALEVFRPYIECTTVTIRLTMPHLSMFRAIKIVHRPGSQQKHVDCLSRAPLALPAGQQPMQLDEFPDRVVLNVALLPADSVNRDASKDAVSLWCNPWCEHLAEVAHHAHKEARYALGAASRFSRPVAKTHAIMQTAGEEGEDSVIVELTEDEAEQSGPGSHDVTRSTVEVARDACSTTARQGVSTRARPQTMQGTRDVPLPSRIPLTTIVQAQKRDEECRKLAEIETQPRDTWPSQLRRSALTLVRVCDILCVRIANGKPRIILPLELREHAIRAHHLSYYGGHFGLHKTRARLAERYWWPSLRRDVKMFMRKCVLCMAHTHDPRRWKWSSLPIGTPFELVAMDLYGPLTVTETGNAYILVFIDHHTRWVELVPLKQPTASTVADAFFVSWISRWGVPRAILSDNGPQFTAELLRHLCQVYGITKLTAAPYHPRGQLNC
ncbi:hypothetical protein Emed_007526 [Eimeria media]